MDRPAPVVDVDVPTRAVTWRSLLLGTILSIGVCALVPLNDFVFSDTSLAAGFIPLSAVLAEFFLVVVLNVLLRALRRSTR
ncbi:MAG: hypothetical protein QM770_10150 [Tepidisphaeraceae bacterium]